MFVGGLKDPAKKGFDKVLVSREKVSPHDGDKIIAALYKYFEGLKPKEKRKIAAAIEKLGWRTTIRKLNKCDSDVVTLLQLN